MPHDASITRTSYEELADLLAHGRAQIMSRKAPPNVILHFEARIRRSKLEMGSRPRARCCAQAKALEAQAGTDELFERGSEPSPAREHGEHR